MKPYVALRMCTHLWLGPRETLPQDWFAGLELALEVQPFGNFAIVRAKFITERCLHSCTPGGITVQGYRPAVNLENVALTQSTTASRLTVDGADAHGRVVYN